MPKITTLELEVVQKTRAQTSALKELANGLRELYDASQGASEAAKGIKEEADALKALPTVSASKASGISAVAKALTEVAASAQGISSSAPDDMKRVADAVAHVVANVKGGAEASKEMTKLAAALKAMNESTISLSGDAGDKIMGISLAIQQLAQSVTGADPDSADWLKSQTQSLAKLSASMAGLAGGGQTLSSIASGFRDLNAAMNMQWPDNVHISDLMSEEVKYLGMYANSLAKISNASNGLKEVPQNIIALSAALKTLMMAVSGSGVAASIFDAQARSIGYASRAITALTKDSDKVAALPGVFEKLAERVQTLFAAMQGQEQNVVVFTVLSKAIAQLARAGVQLTDVSAALKGYNNAVARAEQEIRGAVIAGTQIEVVEHKTRETTKAFSGLNLQIGRTMAKMGGAFGKVLFAPMTAIGRSVSALTGRFGKLFHSIKRIAMYRGIRTFIKAITSGIKSGIDHLYEWSAITDGVFKKSMDSLAESAHYVRDSLGAMIAPLVNALAPAVEYLADKFVELLNAINQTFAYFTGQDSWTKATRQATEYKDVTDDAAGAQKKLNKQLAAFDELNNLTTNEPSSRGKGNKDDNIDADHFTTDTVSVPEWIANIKEAIDNNDWMGAGNALSQHLNEILGKWDGAAAGEWLGQRVSDALNFINGAVSEFHWDELGQKVASFIMGIFTKVTPEDVSGAITSTLNGIIDFFNNLIDGLEFSDIGEWLGKTFAETVNGINWYGLGSFVSNLASGIWDLFGSALSTSFKEINWMENIGALFSGLWGDDGEGLVKAIGTVGLIAGFKLLLSNTFSSKDLKDSAQSGFSGLFGGMSPGQTITLSILATVIASDTWGVIKSIAENGWSVGIDLYFEENPNSSFNITNKLTDATQAAIDKILEIDPTGTKLWEGLWGRTPIDNILKTDPTGTPLYKKMWELVQAYAKAFGVTLPAQSSGAVPSSHKPSTMPTAPVDDDPSGLTSAGGWLGKGFQKAIDSSKTLNTELDKAKTPRAITVTDKNGGLKAGATNAVKLAGKNGLGGVKSSYSTKVTTSGLQGNANYAAKLNSKLGGLHPKYSTKLQATDLAKGAEDATTFSGKLGGIKKGYSTKITAANLSTAASNSKNVNTYLNGINNKTFSATVKVDTENYNNTKKKIDSLNTISEHTVRFKPIIDKSTTGSLISGSGNTANFTLKLDALAQGGFPQGDIFVANEQGPELIGTINGRNAVASNQEITGIADAVYETSEGETALLREQNQLLRQLLAKDNRVVLAPNAAAGRWVNQAQRAYSLATGGV